MNVPVRVGVRVGGRVPLGVTVGVGVMLGVKVRVAVGDGVNVRVGVGVRELVGVAVEGFGQMVSQPCALFIWPSKFVWYV